MLTINTQLNAIEAMVLERVLKSVIRASIEESATSGANGNNSRAFAFAQLGSQTIVELAKKLGVYYDKPNEL